MAVEQWVERLAQGRGKWIRLSPTEEETHSQILLLMDLNIEDPKTNISNRRKTQTQISEAAGTYEWVRGVVRRWWKEMGHVAC
jgi:hypothetical protein